MADTQDELSFVERRLAKEAEWAVPGTRGYTSRQATEDKKAVGGFFGAFTEMLQTSAAASGIRRIQDEAGGLARENAEAFDRNAGALQGKDWISGAAQALFGQNYGKPDYDKVEKYDELTADVPFSMHRRIMDEDNYGAAMRSRRRLLDELDRGRRLANAGGTGLNSIAMFAGAMVDVDVPLMFVTGGGYGAAKLARASLRRAEQMGMTPKLASRFGNAAIGANAGLQAGAMVGAAQAAWMETGDWSLIAESALQGMAAGSVLNGVLRGDRHLTGKAAMQELHTRIAGRAHDNDVSVSPNTAMPSIMPEKSVSPAQAVGDGVEPDAGSAGARSLGTAPAAPRAPLNDPATGQAVPERQMSIIQNARDWRHTSDWGGRKADAAIEDEFWVKLVLSDAANLTTSNYRRLYTSNAATLNWLGGAVFESPHGLGRGQYTASAGMEWYHRNIISPVSKVYDSASNEWAKANQRTWSESGFGISSQGLREFNREVMLELNDRRMGNSSGARHPEVLRAADAFEESGGRALRAARGEDGEIAVDGFENIHDSKGYSPQHWSGHAISEAISTGRITRVSLEEDLASQYQRLNVANREDSRRIAGAVVGRAIARDIASLDTNITALLSGDGRTFLEQALTRNGMSNDEATALIDRLTGLAEERGRLSSAKHRNEVDWNARLRTTDGSELRIVDLLDNNLSKTWQTYTRQISGAAALARVGITNRAARTDIIEAALAEQRALGEPTIDDNLLRAMFSNFNGGPVHGLSFGKINEGLDDAIVLAKRATGLSLLNAMGIPQLAETATNIARLGFQNWWARGIEPLIDPMRRAENRVLLEDLSYVLGDIGEDHKHFAPWLDLDDVARSDRATWMRHASPLMENMQWVQGYTSLFNSVRSWQHKVSTMGLVDKIFRELRELDPSVDAAAQLDSKVLARYMNDLGIDSNDLNRLVDLIDTGVIEFASAGTHDFVNRIHMDRWDPELRRNFASSLVRNMNQVVQKSMAGEEDAWMRSNWGSLMTQLKTFPLAALQKQFMRNIRNVDTETAANLMWGMATAGLVISVKDAINGKSRTTEELARASFDYAGSTSWVSTIFDPVLSAVGLEDYRVNPYGPHASITPPAFQTMQRGYRLPGATLRALNGTADWHDRDALKALPFANTLGMQRLFSNIGDSLDKIRPTNESRN